MRITIGSVPKHAIKKSLLGQNIEMTLDTGAGFLSERLDNPYFAGTVDSATHLARCWEPCGHFAAPGVRFDMVPAMGPWGKPSQLIHNFSGHRGGILQNKRWVQGGERLVVTILARCQNQPARLRFGLRPDKASLPEYGSATIEVTAAYWKEYEATIEIPSRAGTDTTALFSCEMEQPGMIYLDQVHLRPEGQPVLRREMVEALRTLGMGPVRFPGGHASSAYHWWMGTGPQARRATQDDAMFRFPDGMRYEFGTDEYLSLCRDLDIPPHITVNIGSGTPQEAADWAAYCRKWWEDQGLSAPPMYWEIGNETYLVQEVGNSTPAMYLQTLREYVPPIRQAYPKARIIVIGSETYSNATPGAWPWRSVVLEGGVEDLMDLIAVHSYTGVPHDARGAARHKALLNAVDSLAASVQSAVDDLNQRGLKKKVAITEWNLWASAGHNDGKGFLEPYDVEHAIFTALMMNRWIRMGAELELSNFYHLVNPMGVFISRGAHFERTVLADVFQLYRSAAPGRMLDVKVAAPKGEKSAVDAVAVLGQKGKVRLFAVNSSPDSPAELEVKGIAGELRGAGLKGTDFWQSKMASFQLQSRQGRLVLPPLSIVNLEGTISKGK